DVAVGPDGAIYVADWFDARVGGHSTRDAGATGSIYRIAPKGFMPRVPTLDLQTVAGQVAALCNPAPNVRALGFYSLRDRGADAVPAVRRLLANKNPYLSARAVHLLAQLGPGGIAEVVQVLGHDAPQMRIAAFRALRHGKQQVLDHARKLVADRSPAVRREVALSLRDVAWTNCRDLLVKLAKGYDGTDRWYLEALGTAATSKEAALYAVLRKQQPDDPTRWSPAFASIAWRLHTASAVKDLHARALSPQLTREERKQAIDTLAFIGDEAAGKAMVAIATKGPADTFKDATWWVRNRHNNVWRPFDLARHLPAKPAPAIPLRKTIGPASKLPPVATILKLKGEHARGKAIFEARGTCFVCHTVKGKGGQIGPDLTDIAQKFNTAVILENLIDPSANISLGFEASIITTKDKSEIFGFVVGEGDPLLIKDASGTQHAIDKRDISKREKMQQSLMPAAALLNLKAQDLADIVAYLKSIR
ncbi:MAG: c-type cytochrome, partial [Planctomycetota bacterium]|nr:c-type cytochrome [Planctomycetota bacterium]